MTDEQEKQDLEHRNAIEQINNAIYYNKCYFANDDGGGQGKKIQLVINMDFLSLVQKAAFDLKMLILSGCIFEGLTEVSINLCRCTIEQCKITDCTFSDAYLVHASFANSEIIDTTFSGVDNNLERTNFNYCTFRNVTFIGPQKMFDTSFKGAVFKDCNFYGVEFVGCDLSDASFKNCVLDNCYFDCVHAIGADMRGITFKSTRLTGFGYANIKYNTARFELLKNYEGQLAKARELVINNEALLDLENFIRDTESNESVHNDDIAAEVARQQFLNSTPLSTLKENMQKEREALKLISEQVESLCNELHIYYSIETATQAHNEMVETRTKELEKTFNKLQASFYAEEQSRKVKFNDYFLANLKMLRADVISKDGVR